MQATAGTTPSPFDHVPSPHPLPIHRADNMCTVGSPRRAAPGVSLWVGLAKIFSVRGKSSLKILPRRFPTNVTSDNLLPACSSSILCLCISRGRSPLSLCKRIAWPGVFIFVWIRLKFERLRIPQLKKHVCGNGTEKSREGSKSKQFSLV